MNIGSHAIIECKGKYAHLDEKQLEDLMIRAAEASGATVLFSSFHGFGEGCGITGALILAESHITVHTWPEHGYAAFDAFMCGNCDPAVAAKVIAREFPEEATDIKVLPRNVPTTISKAS